jgi:hypothetical protein
MAFMASKSYDFYISLSISQDAIQKGVQGAAPQYATMRRLEQNGLDGDTHEPANEIELFGNGSYQIA